MSLGPATPYTRGSTFEPKTYDRLLKGYPVHAGIDHSPRILVIAGAGLPRTRGDRPIKFMGGKYLCKATPYTRGSTPMHPMQKPFFAGYPVHAGIDP